MHNIIQFFNTRMGQSVLLVIIFVVIVIGAIILFARTEKLACAVRNHAQTEQILQDVDEKIRKLEESYDKDVKMVKDYTDKNIEPPEFLASRVEKKRQNLKELKDQKTFLETKLDELQKLIDKKK